MQPYFGSRLPTATGRHSEGAVTAAESSGQMQRPMQPAASGGTLCSDGLGIDLSWLKDPYRGWTERYPGRKACGYVCSGTPLEVVHAAGLTPVRLLPLEMAVAQALGKLPSFCCALAQGTTERMLRGEMEFLELVVTAHCCDTLKCWHDVWRLIRPELKMLNFSVPIVVGREASGTFLGQEMRHLAHVLGSRLGVQVTDGRLGQSIALYNRQRQMVTELYEQSLRPYTQRWALGLAGLLMPVEVHLDLLAAALDRNGNCAGIHPKGPRLVVTGTTMDSAAIPELLDELGVEVVGDDLCTGQRFYSGRVDELRDPVDGLVQHYELHDSCPGRHNPANPRPERLLQWAQRKGAQGVVLVQPKFCDPCAFDDVQLVRLLRQANLPHVVLETDTGVSQGQLRTRLQALVEMIRPTAEHD
jgi:benzoyl-CoA reductase/2-hydroxyglutaryl-CoA dehydratase subunit BcrC/BadD/HgdB